MKCVKFTTEHQRAARAYDVDWTWHREWDHWSVLMSSVSLCRGRGRTFWTSPTGLWSFRENFML